MIDPKYLRSDPEAVAANLARRGFHFDAAAYRDLDGRRRELQQRTQDLQNERNRRSKAIGAAKQRGEPIEPLKAQVSDLGEQLTAAENALAALQTDLEALHLGLPNLLDEQVPNGNDEADNRLLREWGGIPHMAF